jgi:ubiquitin C-terminal hydrolase
LDNDNWKIHFEQDETTSYIVIEWPDSNVWSFDMEERCSTFSRDHDFNAPPSSRGVSLDDCISRHLSSEEIDEWYCSSCKKHQMGNKKLDIYRLPEILIVHLKRFSMSPYYEDVWSKTDTCVDFPLQCDLSEFVVGDGKEEYDLVAASNHHGSMAGGHYTAFCKVDKEWVFFDDEDSVLVEEPGKIREMGESAYVLFYKRRGGDE